MRQSEGGGAVGPVLVLSLTDWLGVESADRKESASRNQGREEKREAGHIPLASYPEMGGGCKGVRRVRGDLEGSVTKDKPSGGGQGETSRDGWGA